MQAACTPSKPTMLFPGHPYGLIPLQHVDELQTKLIVELDERGGGRIRPYSDRISTGDLAFSIIDHQYHSSKVVRTPAQ